MSAVSVFLLSLIDPSSTLNIGAAGERFVRLRRAARTGTIVQMEPRKATASGADDPTEGNEMPDEQELASMTSPSPGEVQSGPKADIKGDVLTIVQAAAITATFYFLATSLIPDQWLNEPLVK